ncbi:pyridoxal kinase-like [Lineus longissimus]|uniref:pyridoxal kinase-like n=1 Tax=Lineus longissimus TaxID=88925 RepID=UPI002B4DAD27
MSAANCRVLSIQSHVVSGYVGNKSATFPLQVLGFEVDTINSVQFSNHTGYKCFKGQVLKDSDLTELYEGLKENNINHYTHLLTGYVFAKSFLHKVCEVITDLKKVNPNLVYVCDPVMGDNGKLYVPADLLPVYRDHVIPLADIITPNQYEAELLTGIDIKTEADAWKAMDFFHSKGVKTVMISSTDLGTDDKLLGLGSSKIDGKKTALRIEIPKLPASYTGTGDLFAALLLAWMHHHNNDLKIACEKTVSCMQTVLRKTLEAAQRQAGEGNKPTVKELELKMVQCKKDIEEPVITCSAQVLES